MIHTKAIAPIKSNNKDYLVFLGGSIEMGTADLWQEALVESFIDFPDNLVLLNPRRDDWDSSWPQDPAVGTNFEQQVTWELEAQEKADLLVYFFDAKTKSPITLLELGTFGYSNPKRTIVCCPKEFYRYGNVAIFCNRYGITLVHSLNELINTIKKRV